MGLEDLARYETAVVAHNNLKERPDLALIAIQEFYKNQKGLLEDPFVAKYLERAVEDSNQNLQNELGLATDLNNAARIYGKKYVEAFATTKISDLVPYLSTGFSISETAKEAILKYKDATLEDLGKKLKDKDTPKEEQEAIKRVNNAIIILKDRRIEAAGLNVFNKYTASRLDELYPKPKEEGKK